MKKIKDTIFTKGVNIIVHGGCNCESPNIMRALEEGMVLGMVLGDNYTFACIALEMCKPKGRMSKGEAFFKESCRRIDWYKKSPKTGIFLIMDGLEILDTEYLNALMEHALGNKHVTLIAATRSEIAERIKPSLRKRINIVR